MNLHLSINGRILQKIIFVRFIKNIQIDNKILTGTSSWNFTCAKANLSLLLILLDVINLIKLSPEPEVRPVVHVWLVTVVDLASEQLGQGEPRAEGPGPAEPHPDHLDNVIVVVVVVVVIIIITWIVLLGGGGCVTGGKSTVVTQT